MKISLPLIIILFFFIATTCKIKEQNSLDSKNADFVIPIDGTFQISLNSNPSTGYSWQWTNQQSTSVVDTFNFNYVSDYPGRIGGGGKEIWNFRGKKKGLDTINLEYKRVWETNPAIETKKIVVKVK
jgi:inhibitor of cysteine peptidase